MRDYNPHKSLSKMNNDATGTTVRWGYQSIHWSCCGLQLQPPAHRLSPTYRDKRRNHKLSVSPTQDYLFASLQTGFNCKYFRPKKKESGSGHLKAEFLCSDTLRVRLRVRLTESVEMPALDADVYNITHVAAGQQQIEERCGSEAASLSEVDRLSCFLWIRPRCRWPAC